VKTDFRNLNCITAMGALLILLVSSVQTQAAASSGPGDAPLAAFTVNSTIDAVDAAPGNGVCATAGSVCTLTITGTGEDAAATGDLDLTSNVTLTGASAATTIITADWVDRVLHVTGVYTVNISGVTLTQGSGGGLAFAAQWDGKHGQGCDSHGEVLGLLCMRPMCAYG
jgi:hypothetical protein